MNKNTDHGKIINVKMKLDCKTVRNFAYSSTPRFTDFFTDFEKKKPTVLQSKMKWYYWARRWHEPMKTNTHSSQSTNDLSKFCTKHTVSIIIIVTITITL